MYILCISNLIPACIEGTIAILYQYVVVPCDVLVFDIL